MPIAHEIESRLQQAFAPDHLEVINESAQHAGHAGDDGSGESHFRVRMRAAGLCDMTRVQRHRAVHGAIGPDLISRIHALALELDA